MRMCLEQTQNGWEVYYSERGRHSQIKISENETEACLELLRRVINIS